MNDPIQEIKEKIDIVDLVKAYIPLQPAGKNFKAVCPFHKEKTPSFMVSPERQTWHCFGSCNEGGDVFSFLMKYEGVEFYEALKMLAEKAGVELRKISPASQKQFGVLYDINNSAKEYFIKELLDNDGVSNYLLQRGLKKETLNEFEIGFAPNQIDSLTIHLANLGYDVVDIERAGLAFKTERKTYIDRFRGRAMFPIYNTFGKIVGFSGRILPQFDNGNVGKYINSPETLIFNKSKILYGLHLTKSHIRKENSVVLVEGQMDFLMMYQDGVRNVVAVSGTALTQNHLSNIRKLSDNLVLGFDSDEAGFIAIERGIDMANNLDFNVSVFTLKEAKDPAEYVQKNPNKMKLIVQQSVPAMEFYFERYLNEKNSRNKTDKNKIRIILAKINQIISPIEKERWIKLLSEEVGVSQQSLTDELNNLKKEDGKTKSKDDQVVFSLKKENFSRGEKIADKIIGFVLGYGLSLNILNDFLDYFPEKEKRTILFLKGEGSLPEELENEVYQFQMKSSLSSDKTDSETILNEINFLLLELKKEFLKEKRKELTEQIKENKDDKEKLDLLLRQFDEISKLVNN